jgi:uncharacterized repeat protein (TIGR01451 family)
VFGDAPNGDPDDETDDIAALDDAAVDAAQRPRLVLTAAASANDARVGDRIELTFTARNAGNVTLSRLRVSSALTVSGLTCTPAVASLAPRETVTCVAGYRVRRGDVRADLVRAKGVARAESPYGETGRASDDVVATDTTRLAVLGAGRAAPAEETSDPPSAGAPPAHAPPAHAPLAATGGEPLWLIGGLLSLSTAGTALIVLGRRRARRLL